MLIVSNMKLVQSFDQYLGHQTADVYSATHGMSASLSVDDTAIHVIQPTATLICLHLTHSF